MVGGGGLVMVASVLLDRVGRSCQPASSLMRLKLGVVGEFRVALLVDTFLRCVVRLSHTLQGLEAAVA